MRSLRAVPRRFEATSLAGPLRPGGDGLARSFLPVYRLGGGRSLSGSAAAAASHRHALSRTSCRHRQVRLQGRGGFGKPVRGGWERGLPPGWGLRLNAEQRDLLPVRVVCCCCCGCGCGRTAASLPRSPSPAVSLSLLRAREAGKAWDI